jgi:hypothetical protein
MSLYGSDDSNANKTKAEIGVAKSSNTKTIVFIDDTEAQLKVNKDKGLSGPGWWAVDTYTDCHGKTRFKTEHLVNICGPEANAAETQADDTLGADVTSVITPGTVANVTTYAPAGAVATFSDNGGADGSRTAGTYTVTNAAGSSSGTGADFTVVVAANGDPTITLVSGGTGYADSETITIADASLGGGGGAAVVVTVTAAATAAATFTLSGASSTGSGQSLTYQWQRQESGNTNWSNLAGKTSANTGSLTGLTVAADNGAKYRCVVNNSIGGTTAYSTAGTLTVEDRA